MTPACPPMAGRLACCLLLGLLGRGGCHALPAREEPRAPDFSPAGTHPRGDAALGGIARDVVAVHMLKLYERYNREGSRPGDGNTVRSFRARLGKSFPPAAGSCAPGPGSAGAAGRRGSLQGVGGCCIGDG